MYSQRKKPRLPLPIPKPAGPCPLSGRLGTRPPALFPTNVQSKHPDFNRSFKPGYRDDSYREHNGPVSYSNSKLSHAPDTTLEDPSFQGYFALQRKVERDLNLWQDGRCPKTQNPNQVDRLSNHRQIAQNFALLVQSPWDQRGVSGESENNLKMSDLKISPGRNKDAPGTNKLKAPCRFKLEGPREDQENVGPLHNQGERGVARLIVPKRMAIDDRDVDMATLGKRESMESGPMINRAYSDKRRKIPTTIKNETVALPNRRTHRDFVLEYLQSRKRDDLVIKMERAWSKLEAECEFKLLKLFIVLFYFHREYRPELVEFFNDKEIHVFCKFLNRSQCSVEKFLRTKEKLLVLSNKVFNGVEQRKKGYKVTNNKRFIFRKIRMILQAKLIQGKLRNKLLKREKEQLFFAFYFENCPEYAGLTEQEKSDLRLVLNTYEEKRIKVVWRFEKFGRAFAEVFVDLFSHLKESYYREKLTKMRKYINSLSGLDTKTIMKSKLPFKNLPINHNSVEEYKRDFRDSFEEVLAKYVELAHH